MARPGHPLGPAPAKCLRQLPPLLEAAAAAVAPAASAKVHSSHRDRSMFSAWRVCLTAVNGPPAASLTLLMVVEGALERRLGIGFGPVTRSCSRLEGTLSKEAACQAGGP